MQMYIMYIKEKPNSLHKAKGKGRKHMSILLRILVCITGIVLIYMARKANIVRKLTEKQSLFWIIGGVIIILFGLIPQLVYFVSEVFSVDYPPSIIFAIAIVLATYGIFNCYTTNAELSARVQELAMQISLLNEENSNMRERLEKLDIARENLTVKEHREER